MFKFFEQIIGFFKSIGAFFIKIFDFFGNIFELLSPIKSIFSGLFSVPIIGWVFIFVIAAILLFIIIDIVRDFI